jgi:hypothetical protein
VDQDGFDALGDKSTKKKSAKSKECSGEQVMVLLKLYMISCALEMDGRGARESAETSRWLSNDENFARVSENSRQHVDGLRSHIAYRLGTI